MVDSGSVIRSNITGDHVCAAPTTDVYCRILALLFAVVLILVAGSSSHAHDESLPHQGNPPLHAQDAMAAFATDHHPDQQLSSLAITACVGGDAGGFPCSNIDLMALLPLAQIGGGNGNDIWGWADSASGREFAIMGLTNGTAFVEVTDPVNPVYLGRLPLPAGVANSTWRDIKVYAGHAFIGSEALGSGMQVMDLGQLLNVANPPVTFAQTAYYSGFSTSHNIAINEASGYAYAVGTNNGNCGRGLHFVNIQNPGNPQPAGCFGDDGYTHDAQCVIYHGPDAEHLGKEICLAFNEDTLTIVDVSTKSSPVQISRTAYSQFRYSHQGWLTEDQGYLLMDDEADETTYGGNTRTLMWNLADVDNPRFMGYHAGVSTAIDHNQYILGNYSYQANYRSGLRILDITDIANGNLVEVGFFDIYPASDSANFNGAWSVYPFFPSGTVVVSGIEQGLFILRPNLGPATDPPMVTIQKPANGSVSLAGTIRIEVDATDTEDAEGSLDVDWNVDGGPWQNATYSELASIYVADWISSSVPDGTHTISARAIDSNLRQGSDSVSVTTANGTPDFHLASVTVVLVPGNGNRNSGEATIAVLDEADNPLAGVSLEGSFSGDWGGTAGGISASDGLVTLSTPRVKTLVYLQFCIDSASFPGWNFDLVGSVICGDSNGTTAVVGGIDGRVTDVDTSLGIGNAGVSTDSGQNVSTDADGNYSIATVPAGDRTVTVTASGYIGQSLPATVSDSEITAVDFILTAASGGVGTVRGSVADGSGARLEQVLVMVEGGSSASTNKGGKYSIQSVAEGDRTITASKSGYAPQTLQVSVDAGGTVTADFILLPD